MALLVHRECEICGEGYVHLQADIVIGKPSYICENCCAEDHPCFGPDCKECEVRQMGIVKAARIERKRAKKRTGTQLRNNSKAQERDLGKSYREAGFPRSRRVPGSGSIAVLPGDVDSTWFLGEAKMTRTGKMIVQPVWIKKIREQAKQMGKPWWVLHTWTAGGEDQFTKCVTISEDTFFELLRRLKAAEDQLESN